MPREGIFLNEKGFCVARCKVSADGIVSVSETTDEDFRELCGSRWYSFRDA
ncbi:unnamed protein product [Symbiodinium sp. CCMP2592]|nr:unnamed protein product [Symbiodinium sp. CCMP2592]